MPDLHDLAPAYALDALDADERAAFEQHLAACPECVAEVASFAAATDELAWASATPPPADLKDRVMAAIEQPVVDTPVDDTPVARVEPIAGRRRTPMWTFLSAAAVLVLAVSVWAGLSRSGNGDLIAAVENAEDATVVALELPTGAATLTYSLELGEAVLSGADLDAPPGEDVYELWLIDEAGPASAGIFRPDESTILFDGLAAGQTFAITVEPPGGAGGPPTGDVLVAAEL